ncbi:hypothetical protein [Sulfitobacter sp.]|uniref:hypothetical protein n=1 Tax=Sulfitobacter sp. TaxID=1903071 RepID=UPI003F6AE8A4
MNDTHTDEEKTEQAIRYLMPSAGGDDQHVQWLADWREARNTAETTLEDSPEDQAVAEALHDRSVRLATTPALSPAGLVAQIEWFKEDLGGYVLGNASPAHDLIFETLVESVVNLRD